MQDIAVFGAGGFGREVRMLINQINGISSEWNFIGYFDDDIAKGSTINNDKVKGGIEELNNYNKNLGVVVAIGDPQIKKDVIKGIQNENIFYPVLIHPNVQLGNEEDISIGPGTIITAGNIITVNIDIGSHVIFNLGCTAGHDAKIGDYCSFMPGTNISGQVTIGNCTYAGTGGEIINDIEIGDEVIIGAGAVVTKSLPSNCIAVGVPAKIISKN